MPRATSFHLLNTDKKHHKTVIIQILQKSSESVSLFHVTFQVFSGTCPIPMVGMNTQYCWFCSGLCYYPKYFQGEKNIHKWAYSPKHVFLPYRIESTGEKLSPVFMGQRKTRNRNRLVWKRMWEWLCDLLQNSRFNLWQFLHQRFLGRQTGNMVLYICVIFCSPPYYLAMATVRDKIFISMDFQSASTWMFSCLQEH